jgi:cytochrome c553
MTVAQGSVLDRAVLLSGVLVCCGLTVAGCGHYAGRDRGSSSSGGGSSGTAAAASTAAPSTAGGLLGYRTDVKPILAARCVSCHASLSTGYMLSAGLTDDVADHAATVAQIDRAVPDASPLLQKGTNTAQHGGGQALTPGSAEHDTIVQWIRDGALLDPVAAAPGAGPTAPAAPLPSATVPAQPTYLTDIKPLMGACVACHTNEEPRLSPGLSDDQADYVSILGEVDLADPRDSGILEYPTQQDPEHPVRVFDVGSVPYQTIERWIQRGAPFN